MATDNKTAIHCDSHSANLQPLESALASLLQNASPVREKNSVTLAEARDRILAMDLISKIDVPPADNSSMDGYAIDSSDNAEAPLPISQRIPAGTAANRLKAGTAARIFTGAEIPDGADTVIMQENASVTTDPDGNEKVSFNGQMQAGENIRRKGEDIARGETILKAGRKLLPQDIGLAASIGIAEVSVFRRLRVATFFTGDELVQPGQPLNNGQIYNSNQYVLNALLEQLGCDVISLGITQDTLDATIETFKQAAQHADVIITSGGVSVGEEDHVRNALEALGDINFWRVAIKPGKPVAFGKINQTPVIGLPGNPVSVFTTFCLLARPFLLTMQGRCDTSPVCYPVIADFNWNKAGVRREFARARLNTNAQGKPCVELYPNQGSGVLSSTSWADGFVEIREQTTVSMGDTINFYPFCGFFT